MNVAFCALSTTVFCNLLCTHNNSCVALLQYICLEVSVRACVSTTISFSRQSCPIAHTHCFHFISCMSISKLDQCRISFILFLIDCTYSTIGNSRQFVSNSFMWYVTGLYPFTMRTVWYNLPVPGDRTMSRTVWYNLPVPGDRTMSRTVWYNIPVPGDRTI